MFEMSSFASMISYFTITKNSLAIVPNFVLNFFFLSQSNNFFGNPNVDKPFIDLIFGYSTKDQLNLS
jgi:hypothetical protein